MFDISFTEILVIAAVALVVIGPERLPKVARTLGHLFGRAQRYVNDVKSDIQREMELEELKKWKTSVEGAGRSIENTVRTELDKFQEVVEQEAKSATETSAISPEAVSEAVSPSVALPPDSPATPAKPVSSAQSEPDLDAAGQLERK